MIKKLRYFARYIVVCLLLNKNDMVKSLIDELTSYVEEYTRVFKATDSAEWQLVLQEISNFLQVSTTVYDVAFCINTKKVVYFLDRLNGRFFPRNRMGEHANSPAACPSSWQQKALCHRTPSVFKRPFSLAT
jgi:hypothetical protein